MHRQHVQPVPVAGERIGQRRAALRRDGHGARRSRLRRAPCLRAPARRRAPGSASAPSRHRRCAHRGRCPSATGSSAAIDSTEAPCGRRRIDLGEAERALRRQRRRRRCARCAAALRRARDRNASRSIVSAPSGALDRRPRRRAPAAPRRNRRRDRARRDCRRPSPWRARPARRSPARPARRNASSGCAGDLRHRDGGADLARPPGDVDSVEAEPIGEHERADRDVAGIRLRGRRACRRRGSGRRHRRRGSRLRPRTEFARTTSSAMFPPRTAVAWRDFCSRD